MGAMFDKTSEGIARETSQKCVRDFPEKIDFF